MGQNGQVKLKVKNEKLEIGNRGLPDSRGSEGKTLNPEPRSVFAKLPPGYGGTSRREKTLDFEYQFGGRWAAVAKPSRSRSAFQDALNLLACNCPRGRYGWSFGHSRTPLSWHWQPGFRTL